MHGQHSIGAGLAPTWSPLTWDGFAPSRDLLDSLAPDPFDDKLWILPRPGRPFMFTETVDEEDAYNISVDVPGVTADKLTVTVHLDKVRVRAERVYMSGNLTRLEQMVPLDGALADLSGASCELREGVLRVRVPKRDEKESPSCVELEVAPAVTV